MSNAVFTLPAFLSTTKPKHIKIGHCTHLNCGSRLEKINPVHAEIISLVNQRKKLTKNDNLRQYPDTRKESP